MDTRALQSRRGKQLLHSQTEQSPSSDESFSIPSPQLVEKSGVSTPDMFFYQLDADARTCPSDDTRELPTASVNFAERLKSSTRAVDSSSLKRQLDTIQTRKLTTAEEKYRETALRTANLIRQRAYSPLLMAEKKTLKPDLPEVKTQLQPTRFLKDPMRKSVKKGDLDLGSKLQAASPSLSKRTPLKYAVFKGKTLKPLRSLTPQLGRGAPVKNLQK